jgi:glycosyltransferase involved in cell wall biosynthesis
MTGVGVVLAVRNEENSIPRVLDALDRQELVPVEVVAVDDGSRDGTSEFLRTRAHGFRFALTVVSLPYHDQSFVGRPELARVFNAGLRVLRGRAPVPEFVMILGGDHVLPREYVSSILAKMRADPRLAVASGCIAGERFTERSPRGSGMIIRTNFWAKASGLQFPLEYGWESWLYLKAQSIGYQSRSFPDILTNVSRPTSLTKGVLYGRGMYALGYDFAYALGRCISYARYSPMVALQMWRGYLDHRGVRRLDVSDWVGRMQRRTVLRRILSLVARRGFSSSN